MVTYFDYNASAPLDKRVLEKMIDVYTNHYGNSESRTHIYGANAKEIVSSARDSVAAILGVDSTDLIFTSGSTESNNMAIFGLQEYAEKTGKKHLITTAIEHKSVLEPMKHLQKCGYDVDIVYPDETGAVKADDVLNRVRDDTLLVSVMFVNSETGIIKTVQELGAALHKRGVYFHIDATQALSLLNDKIRQTDFDMLSVAAHKIGGPQGIGALVLKTNRKTYMRPQVSNIIYGGTQERGFRPGTTPVALVAGFGLAAQICMDESVDNYRKCEEIKSQFMRAVDGLEYHVNGDPKKCLPSTINIGFKGIDAESIFVAMKENYAFSNGSACNASLHKPSYVLMAMGLSDDLVSESVRLSWSGQTKVDFSELVKYIRSMN